MSSARSSWNRIFSPTIEDYINYNSSPSVGAKLTVEEIEALNMWVNKQHGILPNQYHYAYEQGDTLIYPEHIADLLTIDKMMTNKINTDKKKEEAAQKHKQKNPAGTIKQGGEGFYGHTFKFNQNK